MSFSAEVPPTGQLVLELLTVKAPVDSGKAGFFRGGFKAAVNFFALLPSTAFKVIDADDLAQWGTSFPSESISVTEPSP